MAEEIYIPTVRVEFKDAEFFLPQRKFFDCRDDADEWFAELKDNYKKFTPTVDTYTHFENDKVAITKEDYWVPTTLIAMIKCLIEGNNVIG